MNIITRGDLLPGLTVNIGDARGDADFTTLQPEQYQIAGEQNGQLKVLGQPDTVAVATDGKSATLKRAWAAGETDEVGIMWITVRVDWGNGKPQTFPRDEAIALHIRRRAGDP